MNCLHCTAETTNGLALCDLCRRRASDCLASLPVYFRNLSRWHRSGRPNGSLGVAGQWLIRRGDGDVNHIAIALERASNDLTTWARALADDRDVELPDAETEAATVARICELLADRLATIGTLEWAGQFVRDVDRHERNLRGLTEFYIPGWYAGECRRCTSPTYVVPGLTWVTCGSCGATTFARDHLDSILAEAREWVARPMRIAEALVALVDTEVSVSRLHKRISKWGERNQIMVIRDNDYAPKRYRLGEVLDRLCAEGATRVDDEGAAHAG